VAGLCFHDLRELAPASGRSGGPYGRNLSTGGRIQSLRPHPMADLKTSASHNIFFESPPAKVSLRSRESPMRIVRCPTIKAVFEKLAMIWVPASNTEKLWRSREISHDRHPLLETNSDQA
jgi:hypothetical protein